MTWGPFVPGRDPIECKSRLRCLRLAVKLLTGPRGKETCFRLLVAQIDTHEDTIAVALAEFERLGTLDQRRVLASYLEVA